MAEVAYLLRHGAYEHGSGRLTQLGLEQAEHARDNLIARELGSRAYLLSSDAQRALETAAIIGDGLCVDIIPSPRVRRGSEHRHLVNVLGDFLLESLRQDAEIEADPTIPFVVVAHAPLVAQFTELGSPGDVENGCVYKASTDQYDPEYDPDVAEFILSGKLETR